MAVRNFPRYLVRPQAAGPAHFYGRRSGRADTKMPIPFPGALVTERVQRPFACPRREASLRSAGRSRAHDPADAPGPAGIRPMAEPRVSGTVGSNSLRSIGGLSCSRILGRRRGYRDLFTPHSGPARGASRGYGPSAEVRWSCPIYRATRPRREQWLRDPSGSVARVRWGDQPGPAVDLHRKL